jgi:hypothetical protein
MVARVLIVAALLLAPLAGCEKRSALYCEKNPEDLANCDPPPDAPPPMMCADNSSCTTADRPFCQLDSHVCVGCLTSADCQDPTKLNCDPLSFTCRGCVKHADCPSNACLPGGVCGDDSNVIYVDGTNGIDMGGDGTKEKPKKTWAEGLKLVTATRKHMKVSGTQTTSVLIDTKIVIVLAEPGAKIVGSADPALKIVKSTVKIIDLEIACPATPAIGGIKTEMMSTTTLEHVYIHGCGKIALEATEKFLALARSNIEGNGEGVIIGDKADYVITNNFIVRNGSTSSMNGGVKLGKITPTQRFEFNTVAHNAIADGLLRAGGVNCAVVVGDSLTIPNNLLIGNTGGSGNVAGSCTPTGSANEADDTPYAFKSIVAPYDYHLMMTSIAIDASTIPSVIADDIDGELRPQGPNRDLGADEYRP